MSKEVVGRRQVMRLAGAVVASAVLPTPEPVCKSKALSTNGTPVVVPPGKCEAGWAVCCTDDNRMVWREEWERLNSKKQIPNKPQNTPFPVSPTDELSTYDVVYAMDTAVIIGSVPAVAILATILLYGLTVGLEKRRRK